MTDTEEGYLVFLDPMPLVEYVRPFYDGQPRDNKGRFAHGKMPDFNLVIKSDNWCGFGEKTTDRAKNIAEILSGKNMQHHGIGEEIRFYTKGLKHTVGTHDSPNLERLMRCHDVLQAVFSRGDCKEHQVHDDKKHYADKCWHVKSSVHFNGGKTSHVEFVILHHTEMKCNVLYDVTIK